MTRETRVARRTVLRATGGAAVASVAGLSVPRAAAADGFGDWFENVPNFDGVVDRTGESEVTVEVGVDNGGQAVGFGPAAVRVDPGTTVAWTWTGNGGIHNVVAADGTFESELVDEGGHTFTRTLDSTGVVKYSCLPHETTGMKGAVVVGDVDVDAAGSGATGGNAGEGAPDSSAGGAGDVDLSGWLGDVPNYEEPVDRTGEAAVTVRVGADSDRGAFAFDPPAVVVSPGARVVWEWTGRGSSHNVVEADGRFESSLTEAAGHTFARRVESTARYYCRPHRQMGMKGAVVVDESATPVGGSESALGGLPDGALLVGGGLLGAVLSPVLFFAFLLRSGDGDGRSRGGEFRPGRGD